MGIAGLEPRHHGNQGKDHDEDKETEEQSNWKHAPSKDQQMAKEKEVFSQ
jgi:hypothetical protein